MALKGASELPQVDVGIDFGTTNSAIAYRAPGSGRVTVRGPLPSVGAWSNDRIVFGTEALRLLRSGDRAVHPLRDIKMQLGGGGLVAGQWPIDAVDAAAGLFEHIRESIAATVPSEDIGNAVIGTPVRVSREHRVALRRAAQLAGFVDLRLVYEPTAALIGARDEAYLGRRGLVLVVDWGGGTLDVAVIHVVDGTFRELSVYGDTNDLGGSSMDEALTRTVLASAPSAAKAVDAFPQGFFRLMEEVEEEKIDILSDLDETGGKARSIVPEWLDYELRLAPDLVMDVVRSFAGQAAGRIRGMLTAAGVLPSDITQILFAGGACNSRLVRDQIRAAFPHAEILSGNDPQLLTAHGCGRLSGRDFGVELASDFVVREADDSLRVLLERGLSVDLDAYRRFDFRVTDADATEAHFDFGIHHDPATGRSPGGAEDGFQSLDQLHVPVARATTPRGHDVPDIVRLFVGVDHNLTVAVHGEGSRLRQSANKYLSAVPLAVRVSGA